MLYVARIMLNNISRRKTMFRIGETVIHPEYGLGKFIIVKGQKVKIAVVEFPLRGQRYFTLPSENLATLAEIRQLGWKRLFGKTSQNMRRQEEEY